MWLSGRALACQQDLDLILYTYVLIYQIYTASFAEGIRFLPLNCLSTFVKNQAMCGETLLLGTLLCVTELSAINPTSIMIPLATMTLCSNFETGTILVCYVFFKTVLNIQGSWGFHIDFETGFSLLQKIIIWRVREC